jgi:hypothetical protein
MLDNSRVLFCCVFLLDRRNESLKGKKGIYNEHLELMSGCFDCKILTQCFWQSVNAVPLEGMYSSLSDFEPKKKTYNVGKSGG